MDSKEFLTSYLNDFSDLVKPDEDIIHQLAKVADLLKDVQAEGKKIIIFGNGGSAAIASHFSVDLTKNAGLRCINCNESDLITCFANDYGFERWVEKAVDFYGDEGDLLIVISSSGNSKNMLNGVKAARNGKFKAVVTFSGFKEDNPLHQSYLDAVLQGFLILEVGHHRQSVVSLFFYFFTNGDQFTFCPS